MSWVQQGRRAPGEGAGNRTGGNPQTPQAADRIGVVAPGSIISIYGANLTSELKIGPSNPLSQTIDDMYVTVNGSILPLIFVSPTQINAQLLSTLGEGDYTLQVSQNRAAGRERQIHGAA